MTEPRLSIVIPWANRPELERTLRHNARPFARAQAEVIVACCGGDMQLLEQCTRGVKGTALCTVEVRAPFNRSLALNVGSYHARADTLFFLDADLELEDDSLSDALARVSETRVVTLDRVVESAPPPKANYRHLRSIANIVEIETGDGKIVRVETSRRRLHDGSRSAHGMVFLRKDCFERVGGMNSDLQGWGWEDLDLLTRLKLTMSVCIERAGSATHLSHGDDRRSFDGSSREASDNLNAAMCMANYGLGYYFGTYEDDVATHCQS